MKRFVDELMREFVNYGGMAATREEVYFHAKSLCGERAADRFAFLPCALTPEEVEQRLRFDEYRKSPNPKVRR